MSSEPLILTQEEFLNTVLELVDILCETIKTRDLNSSRGLEVSQNLNEAVSCYRIKLLYKQIETENKDQEKSKNNFEGQSDPGLQDYVLDIKTEKETFERESENESTKDINQRNISENSSSVQSKGLISTETH